MADELHYVYLSNDEPYELRTENSFGQWFWIRKASVLVNKVKRGVARVRTLTCREIHDMDPDVLLERLGSQYLPDLLLQRMVTHTNQYYG